MTDIHNGIGAVSLRLCGRSQLPSVLTDVAAHKHLGHSVSERSRGTVGVRDGGQATEPLNETA